MDRSHSGRQGRADVPPHAHVLGVEAPGGAGVAECLVRHGLRVTGAPVRPDSPVWRLREAGVRVHDHRAIRPWTRGTRLLVHAPEVGRGHPLRLGALRRGIRQQTPESWLVEQMAGRLGVAFVGGREATAAAAMTAWVLSQDGADPSVLLRTPCPQLGGRARVGRGCAFVADWPGAWEVVTAARPGLVVLLGPGAEAVRRVVEGYEGGAVLAFGHPSGWRGDEGAAGRLEWLSLRRGADWWATDLREDAGRFRFRIFHRGRYVVEVRLRAPGLRNVVGALAAAAAGVRLGVTGAAVRDGLEEFGGLARDFERRGTYRGVTLVDDEADAPGPVHDALALARLAYRGRRLWAVFAAPAVAPDPAEARRFVAAFARADLVTITEGPPAGGGHGPGRVLATVLDAAGVRVGRAGGLDDTVRELERRLEPGDVLLTLGAGDVGTIADAFLRRLPRDRPGG